MRADFASLNEKKFDVLVVGGGMNGAATAQELSAAGYSVLLVEKDDYAAGSSSRSSRLAHCGLRFLAPGGSMFRLADPRILYKTLRAGRTAMHARSMLVRTMPQRLRPIRMIFPLYSDGPYAPWQIDAAFGILRTIGGGAVPLEYRRLSAQKMAQDGLPFVSWLRDPSRLTGAATYAEYQFDWPERLVMDIVLDAERLGATVRNYTSLVGLQREGEGWKATLGHDDQLATVSAKAVINTAGIWIDKVNGLSGAPVKQRVLGTKGAHIVVRLPDNCRGHGIASMNRNNEPFYCMPWRDLHFFGPTETVYTGDPDDIHATAADVDFLVAEANHLLPGMKLTRDQIKFTWAGVRPLTYNPAMPKGERSRTVHDLASDGLDGIFALTNGSLSAHRTSAADLRGRIAERIKPSGKKGIPSYSPQSFPTEQNSPPLLDDYTDIKLSDLVHAAANEHVVTLSDLLERRTGVVWTSSRAIEAAQKAAEVVAPVLGWDAARCESEVRDYIAEVERLFPRMPAA
jgi:glycerol-3-phosphate dehydrogenase